MAKDKEPQFLTAEGILAAQDMDAVVVDAPEWGGQVKVRGLTLNEVMDIRKATNQDERLMVVHTFALAFVEPRLDLAQAEALCAKSGAVTQRILVAINTLNGMDAAGNPAVAAAQARFHAATGNAPGTGPGAGPGDDQEAATA